MRELLDAAEDFLRRDLRPQLEGHAAFHTLVTANVVGIVKRELDAHQGLNVAESGRLRRLLGRDGELRELNIELCRKIREGDIAIDEPGLVEHLVRTTLGKIAIDNPRYAGYRRALENWPEAAPPEPPVFDARS